MRYDSERHHRRSIRLQDYDYSSPGAYYVTICVHERECLLGDVIEDQMALNDVGRIVQDTWLTLPICYPGTALDAFVVMPNHIHGIIVVGAIHELPLPHVRAVHEPPVPPPQQSPRRTERRRMLLPKMIGYFKMNAAKRANETRSTPGVAFWQRNYYEHIVRNERELHAIRQYIHNNPLKWALDRDNPIRLRPIADTVKVYLREAGV